MCPNRYVFVSKSIQLPRSSWAAAWRLLGSSRASLGKLLSALGPQGFRVYSASDLNTYLLTRQSNLLSRQGRPPQGSPAPCTLSECTSASLAEANAILHRHPPLSSGLLRNKPSLATLTEPLHTTFATCPRSAPTSMRNALTSNSPLLVDTKACAKAKVIDIAGSVEIVMLPDTEYPSFFVSSSAPNGMRHNIWEKVIVSG